MVERRLATPCERGRWTSACERGLFCSLDRFSLLTRQDSVNGLVEQVTVGLHVEASRVRLAFDLVEPARGVGSLGDLLDFLPEHRIAAGKLAAGDAEQI